MRHANRVSFQCPPACSRGDVTDFAPALVCRGEECI